MQCPPLPKIKNGEVYITGLQVGSKAGYWCFKGFILKGASTLKCLSTGHWSSQPPVCEYQHGYNDDDDFYGDDEYRYYDY